MTTLEFSSEVSGQSWQTLSEFNELQFMTRSVEPGVTFRCKRDADLEFYLRGQGHRMDFQRANEIKLIESRVMFCCEQHESSSGRRQQCLFLCYLIEIEQNSLLERPPIASARPRRGPPSWDTSVDGP